MDISLQKRIWQRCSGLLKRNIWALSDQALVSVMNFLTAALLARWLGITLFGIFSVFYILMQYLNNLQLSVIVSPMMTHTPQIVDEPERLRFLRGIMGMQYVYTALSVFLLCLGIVVAEHWHLTKTSMSHVGLTAFALACLAFLLQDWLRRFFYVESSYKKLFGNDLVSYLGQVVILFVLWKTATLNITSAFLAVAVTSLAAFVIGVPFHKLRLSVSSGRDAFKRSWSLIKHLFVSGQLQWAGSQGILLIVAATVDVRATGGMRAIITLFGPINIFYSFLDNLIPIRSAQVYGRSGREATLHYMRRTSLGLASCIGAFCLLSIALAPWLMGHIFGERFKVFAGLVVWQAIYTFLALIYRQVHYFYRTVGQSHLLARAAFMAAVVSVSGCFFFTRSMGVTGAMIAMDLGQITNVVMPVVFSRFSGKQAAVTKVVH